MSTIDVVSAVADHVGGVEQTETSISTINKNNDDDKEISDLMHDFQVYISNKAKNKYNFERIFVFSIYYNFISFCLYHDN
jgi:hypothetical protein